MKKLTLIISGNTSFEPNILIDNKKLKYKKNKMRNRIYQIETDKDEIDIEMYKWFEIESKYWLFTHIFFFIISFFGLFDIKENRKPYSLKYKGKIKLSEGENELKIILNPFKPNEQSFVWEGNCSVDYNDTSKYFIDEGVNEKRRKLKKIKKTIKLCVLAILIIITVLLLR